MYDALRLHVSVLLFRMVRPTFFSLLLGRAVGRMERGPLLLLLAGALVVAGW